MLSHNKNDLKFPLMDGPVWHRSSWSRLILISLVLAVGVTLLDLVIPGLPGSNHGPVGRLMALLSGICVQRLNHSYTLGGMQLPLEARMTGLYGGLAAGIIELTTIGRRRIQRWPRLPMAVAFALGFGVMVFDGFNALLFDLGLPHAYTPDLRLRLISGLLAGIALAFALVPLLAQFIRPGAAFPHAASPQWRDVGWTVLAGGVFTGLVASGWAPLLYPVALLSTAGVVLAFAVVNRVVLEILLNQRMVGRGRLWRDRTRVARCATPRVRFLILHGGYLLLERLCVKIASLRLESHLTGSLRFLLSTLVKRSQTTLHTASDTHRRSETALSFLHCEWVI